MNKTHKKELLTIDGKLNEMVTIHDDKGNIMHRMISPLRVEFHPKDIVQVVVGATLLAIPLAYTEETWGLGASLPIWNILGIFLLSIIFISIFTYYNYHSNRLRRHKMHFFRRVIGTYLISLILVACVLTLIMQAPWMSDPILALKRMVIVGFPASMSAAIADTL